MIILIIIIIIIIILIIIIIIIIIIISHHNVIGYRTKHVNKHYIHRQMNRIVAFSWIHVLTD